MRPKQRRVVDSSDKYAVLDWYPAIFDPAVSVGLYWGSALGIWRGAASLRSPDPRRRKVFGWVGLPNDEFLLPWRSIRAEPFGELAMTATG